MSLRTKESYLIKEWKGAALPLLLLVLCYQSVRPSTPRGLELHGGGGKKRKEEEEERGEEDVRVFYVRIYLFIHSYIYAFYNVD